MLRWSNKNIWRIEDVEDEEKWEDGSLAIYFRFFCYCCLRLLLWKTQKEYLWLIILNFSAAVIWKARARNYPTKHQKRAAAHRWKGGLSMQKGGQYVGHNGIAAEEKKIAIVGSSIRARWFTLYWLLFPFWSHHPKLRAQLSLSIYHYNINEPKCYHMWGWIAEGLSGRNGRKGQSWDRRGERGQYIRIVKGRPRGAKREINHFPANGLTSVIKLISQLCAAKTG